MSAISAEIDIATYVEAIDRSGIGSGCIDLTTGRVVMASPRLCEIAGRTEAALMRKTWTELSPPEEHNRVTAALRDLAAGAPTERLRDAHLVRGDGRIAQVHVTLTGARQPGQSPRRALLLVQEASGRLAASPAGFEAREGARQPTERSEAEQALARSEARYKAIVEDQTELICRFLPDGVLTFVNPAYCRYFDKRPEELIGHSFMPLLPAEDRNISYDSFQRLSPDKPFASCEHRVIVPSGEIRWQSWTDRAIFDDAGNIVEYQSVGRDITERKQVEEALRVSEERFRRALEGSQVTVFEQDSELRYTWLHSPSVEGSAPGALIGKRDTEVMPPSQAAALEAIKRRVLETGVSARQEVLSTQDGGERCFDLSIDPMRDTSGAVVGISCSAVDVTERVQLEAKLRQQAEQLAEADRRKDEFLAMLAHELRNPLAGIRSAVELLRMPAAQPAFGRAVDVIDRQSDQLTRLVDDLLDVARISGGRIHLDCRSLSARMLIERAVEGARPFIKARRQHLDVSTPPAAVHVHADATRIVQIIGNLLHNAAKFTPEGGRISLNAEVCGDELLIRVRDTGVGIPADLLPRIFEPFVQADTTLERSQGGLGLGLTLARTLVEMHGGTIEARSKTEGPEAGSELLVRLPVQGASAAGAPLPAGPAVPSAPQQPRRILVVDDNVDSAETLAMLIERQGHVVAIAHDGPGAIERAREFVPEVVLLDIGLPGINGYEVARHLRREHARPMLLVALTGYGQADDLRRAQEAGFDHHMLKPVSLDALYAVLEQRAPSDAPS